MWDKLALNFMKKYNSEKDISNLVVSFENASVSAADWRHAEHLIVALYYLTQFDLETATNKMRDGIFNLLKSFNIDLTKMMPYHETLTIFWMRTVDDFRSSKDGNSVVEIGNELIKNFDKDFPFKFYSRELLFSDEARAKFVEPDLP